MTEPIKSDPETPYALEDDQKTNALVDKAEDVAGFYICRNWFSKQPFNVYPQQGYKPAYLKELNDGLWCEFNREVQHYQKYHTHISWTYKIWTLGPTIWFLAMVLPDLLLYYEIIVKGVGVVCGLVLALAFLVDTYYQRRLQRKKVHPMYSLLMETYKSRFLLHGYIISYEFEPTLLDGMNSFILFRKATDGQSLDSVVRHDVDSSQLGFYLDEDLLGKKPYALGMSSRIHPPRFLQGMDAGTWKAFAKAIEDRSKTPRYYLLGYMIGMGLLVGVFVFALIYCVVFIVNVRHLLLITLFPLYQLVETMKSFRRRHYLENVLANEMTDLVTEYQEKFGVAGFEATFELEYVYHYLCCNSYFNFRKLSSKYVPTESAEGGEIA